MSVLLAQFHRDFNQLKNPQKAKFLQRFFKTGKGEYAEGDVFWGLTVPQSRSLVKKYKALSLTDIKILLTSKIHEQRLIALLLLVDKFNKGDEKVRPEIFKLYLAHTKYINNWDLVDLSAGNIVGAYLTKRPRDVLYKLARSKNLWEKRIAMIATFYFIYELKEYEDTFTIAEILLHDTHDLIHKAVGWMLREVGKRISRKVEKQFLDKHAHEMPRTMLRYAIEHFAKEEKMHYMSLKSRAGHNLSQK
ncbi:DNA alkylation repair protein [Candidatus Microgenomates bacterium]|nr:MAG: DNA alkylation repair protein [Candidatus Microgenomates bacterium]